MVGDDGDESANRQALARAWGFTAFAVGYITVSFSVAENAPTVVDSLPFSSPLHCMQALGVKGYDKGFNVPLSP